MENKFNWGTFILGLVIGAIVVAVVFLAGKPAKSGATGINNCVPSESGTGCICNVVIADGSSALRLEIPNVPGDVCDKIGNPN